MVRRSWGKGQVSIVSGQWSVWVKSYGFGFAMFEENWGLGSVLRGQRSGLGVRGQRSSVRGQLSRVMRQWSVVKLHGSDGNGQGLWSTLRGQVSVVLGHGQLSRVRRSVVKV